MFLCTFTIACSFLCSQDFSIKSIYEIMQDNPEVEYIKIEDSKTISIPPFPLASNFNPSQKARITFPEKFIVTIPNGKVFKSGFVIYQDQIISTFFRSSNNSYIKTILEKTNLQEPHRTLPGTIAVIEAINSNCYYHWLFDVFSRLIMLKNNNISYDWLYVSSHRPFMKELLQLAGVDASKIITPTQKVIQADKIIIPCQPRSIQNHKNHYPYKCWQYDKTIAGLRKLVLPLIATIPDQFSKRIFISRKDANRRNILNEDELFDFLKTLGFERYALANMSIIEQAALFNRAEAVIGAQGSSLTNILYCNPKTIVIELYQTINHSDMFYLSQQMNLSHFCIKTMEFNGNLKENSYIPLSPIKKLLTKILE